jgi:hypothetical protein
MALCFNRTFLRSVSQGLAVAMLLVAMVTMAFAAGLAFLGVMIALPVLLCLKEVRRHLRLSGMIRAAADDSGHAEKGNGGFVRP